MANRDPEHSFTTPKEPIAGLPDAGWRVKLDYECTEKCKPFQTPRLSQLPSLVGLSMRYIRNKISDFSPHIVCIINYTLLFWLLKLSIELRQLSGPSS